MDLKVGCSNPAGVKFFSRVFAYFFRMSVQVATIYDVEFNYDINIYMCDPAVSIKR